MFSYRNRFALGMEMESFYQETISNTATRKRPKEAPGVLELLWFYVKTCNAQLVKTPVAAGTFKVSVAISSEKVIVCLRPSGTPFSHPLDKKFVFMGVSIENQGESEMNSDSKKNLAIADEIYELTFISGLDD